MQIICPNCEFTRTVDEDQIPPRSKVATCPQCGQRFQFRELPDEEPAAETDADAPVQADGHDAAQPEYYGPDGRGLDRPQLETDPPPVNGRDGQVDRNAPDREPSAAERYLAAKQAEAQQDVDDDMPSGPVQVEVPFEDLENFGFFSGMAQTIKRACLSPRLFFSVMPLRGLARPMVFGLLVVEFMVVMGAFWQLSGVPDLTSMMMEYQGMQPPSIEETLNPLTLFVVMPLGYVFNLVLSTLVVHGILSVVGGAKRGFEGSFRVMAYAYAPIVLGAVPFGLLPAAIWSLVISVIGLKHMHSTDYARSVLAHVVIFLVMALFYFVPMVPISTGG